ncbi:MAG: PaaI family thioesterase [Cellvibrionaceae bacterium]
MTDLPDEFEPLFRTSPYLEMIGPIYNKKIVKSVEDVSSLKGIVIGFFAQKKHCNARGLVHGGIVSGIADIALGYNASLSKDPPVSMVTTNLSIDYVGAIKMEEWVEVHVDVQKVGSRVAFANCYFVVKNKRLARASGVFNLV